MLCDNCKINNAILKYNKFINNQKSEYNLCSNCAKKFEQNLAFSSMLKDFFVNFENNPIIKCEICGNTLYNIKSSAKMGCSNCYKTFKQNILPIIKNFQFDYKHTGKGKIFNQTNKLKNEINLLKVQLNQAVKSENFEQAIILRDKIKQLEKGD